MNRITPPVRQHVHADAMPGATAEEKITAAIDTLVKLVKTTPDVEVILKKELLS